MTAIRKASFVRLLALLAVLALVVAACTGDGATDTTGADVEETTPETGDTTPETEPEDSTPSTDAGDDGGTGEGFTFTMGVHEDFTTDNVWNAIDQGNSVYNSYLLIPTTANLYDITYPGLEVQPEVAAGELPDAVQEGDVWVAEVTLRDDVTWSDGEPLTAEDVAFTWNTAVEFNLGVNWVDYADADIVESVEAVDDTTLRVTFNDQPGVAVWGLGNGVPLMPIMPEHHWAPIVEAAAGTEDPRQTLLAESGEGAPALGPTVFEERQEASFAAAVANEHHFAKGEEITSGGVTYTVGPFASDYQYVYYDGQDQAVLALANGDIDYHINPLGMQQAFLEVVQGNENLTGIVNATNGYRFLAFNHSRAPMSDSAFRDALAIMINKEFVTEQLLQGQAFPLYVILPEGNEPWYNAEAATELSEANGAGMDDDARRAEAIRILREAGYSWESAPGWTSSGSDEISDQPGEGLSFRPGDGLIDPDGNPVPTLELVHPTASYDPMRATFGTYIAGVAQELGIPVVSVPTDFNKIIADHYTPDSEGNYPLEYDMHILGYSLGNAAFPTFHGQFFGTGAGANNLGYSSEELDQLSADFSAARTKEEAYDILWEMERVVARDKPHVPLFDTGIVEFYNSELEFPFTETLSGLQFAQGFPELVSRK